MRSRTTPVLALLVLLLGAYLLVWEHGDRIDRDGLSRMRRSLRIDPDRVEALAIETPSTRLLCRRRGDSWFLAEPTAARADASRIHQLLAILRELPRGEVLLPDRRDPAAWAHYGLEPPHAAISVVQGTATNRFLVGRRSPLGDGVYVRQDGIPAVVRISAALLDLLPSGAEALRARTLLRGDPSAVARLEIRNASGYIQLAREPSGPWRILQPVATRADPVPIATLVRELLACTIVQFVQDGVTCYPDLIKVGISLESGALTGFEAAGYLMNHRERELPEPASQYDADFGLMAGEDTGHVVRGCVNPFNTRVHNGWVLVLQYLCQYVPCAGEDLFLAFHHAVPHHEAPLDHH